MEDFNLTRLAYYVDFVVFPMLAMLAIWGGGLSWSALALVPVGFVAWTFTEYWLHREVFHHLYRRQHWVHHIRPTSFIGVHPAHTGIAGLLLLGALWGSVGATAGTALFCGFTLGYMAYIGVHDCLHHGRVWGRYLRRRAALHELHHTGPEVNFGVTTAFWDGLYGTFWHPSWSGEISPRRVLTL